MIQIQKKASCSGCSACCNICPVGAITMVADEEGFLYPQVNTETCIQCRKCEKQCPILHISEKNGKQETPAAYAVQIKDDATRMNSTSGGVFTEIATYILEKQGVVFGAAFDKDLTVRHIAVETIEDLEKLRGSKYLQSRIETSFADAKAYLDAGRTVLFSGTPCQIEGLYCYLNRDYENLYTQDIICHGVPAPMVWKKYVQFREEEAASKTRRTFFRHKKNGWKMYSVQFEFANCTEYIRVFLEDPYMRSFLRNLDLRPSCYECAFKSLNRQSDITLADFWGIEKLLPGIDDDKGTSLVLIHSTKGAALLTGIRERLGILQKVNAVEAIRDNPAAIKSSASVAQRDAFVKCVNQKGFAIAAKKYLNPSVSSRIKHRIGRVLKKV